MFGVVVSRCARGVKTGVHYIAFSHVMACLTLFRMDLAKFQWLAPVGPPPGLCQPPSPPSAAACWPPRGPCSRPRGLLAVSRAGGGGGAKREKKKKGACPKHFFLFFKGRLRAVHMALWGLVHKKKKKVFRAGSFFYLTCPKHPGLFALRWPEAASTGSQLLRADGGPV